MQSGHATYGVVPFENSTNGSVVFTLDLFADQHSKHPDIIVCGERYVEVHHCLLGHPAPPPATPTTQNPSSAAAAATADLAHKMSKSPSSSGHATPIPGNPNPAASRAAPLTSLAHVRKLYSHPQAWGQCKTFLSCHLKGVERQDVSSTSRAAELVAADTTGTTAAISSGIAAKMHNVGFLAKDIEDESDNATRFLILRKTRGGAGEGEGGGEGGAKVGIDASEVVVGNGDAVLPDFKSLLSFTVSHTDPGALADALAVFKRHGLNLTSINPRPSGEAPWHYMFFVEFQGKRGEETVDVALEDLSRVVRAWRWLGSWGNALVKK